MSDAETAATDQAHEEYRRTWLKTALHATIWFAHRMGVTFGEIEDACRDAMSNVKSKIDAEIARAREALDDGA